MTVFKFVMAEKDVFFGLNRVPFPNLLTSPFWGPPLPPPQGRSLLWMVPYKWNLWEFSVPTFLFGLCPKSHCFWHTDTASRMYPSSLLIIAIAFRVMIIYVYAPIDVDIYSVYKMLRSIKYQVQSRGIHAINYCGTIWKINILGFKLAYINHIKLFFRGRPHMTSDFWVGR